VISSEKELPYCMGTLLKFCEQYESQTRIDEFVHRNIAKSSFNLPIQLGNSPFPTTKYRLIGQLFEEDSGTQINIKIKDDIYWTVINAVTPFIILLMLINDFSLVTISLSLIFILAALIRWLRTSNDFTRIESELRVALT